MHLVGTGQTTGETRASRDDDAEQGSHRCSGPSVPGLWPRADCLTRPEGPTGRDATRVGRWKRGPLRREGNRSGVGRSHGEPGKDRQVDVQRHPLDPAHPKREHRPFVLQPAELTLDAGTGAVEGLPPIRFPRDERVQPVGLDPQACRGALTRGAAVLGRATLSVGTGEGPHAVVALRRGSLASLDERRLPQRDNGVDAARLAPVVEPGRPVQRVASRSATSPAISGVERRRLICSEPRFGGTLALAIGDATPWSRPRVFPHRGGHLFSM